MRLTTETAKVYKLKGEKEDKHPWAWAVIIIRSWEGGGSIDAQTDYGNYAYIWSSIGASDIREFLCNVDYGYFMGKAHHTRGYVTDWEATAGEIRSMVLKARRCRDMEVDTARECLDALEAIDKDDGFFWQVREYEALYRFVRDHDFPKVTVRDGQCNGFWTVIWPEMCRIWTEELKLEAEARSAPEPIGEGSNPIPSPQPSTPEGTV